MAIMNKLNSCTAVFGNTALIASEKPLRSSTTVLQSVMSCSQTLAPLVRAIHEPGNSLSIEH
ncbi:MAG: hypothetical protein JWQ21_1376 [Herminiimonas sp.]|nr:hypothetical protein [Herminiimonas sp.]